MMPKGSLETLTDDTLQDVEVVVHVVHFDRFLGLQDLEEVLLAQLSLDVPTTEVQSRFGVDLNLGGRALNLLDVFGHLRLDIVFQVCGDLCLVVHEEPIVLGAVEQLVSQFLLELKVRGLDDLVDV
jgi:hypothetical protein